MKFRLAPPLLVLAGMLFFVSQPDFLAADPPATGDGLSAYGVMREVIGQGQSQARVSLRELAHRPHFYGVGAVEGLAGEISLLDSKPTLTAVGADGKLRNALKEDSNATLLIGQTVTAWKEIAVQEDIAADDFDRHLRGFAEQQGLPGDEPFIFLVEGEFLEMKLHVINGACPVHARANGMEIDKQHRPYELSSDTIRGTMVGVHALNAAGRMTHPGTTTHRHLVFEDAGLKQSVTGHVERAGVKKGAKIKLAARQEPDSKRDQ